MGHHQQEYDNREKQLRGGGMYSGCDYPILVCVLFDPAIPTLFLYLYYYRVASYIIYSYLQIHLQGVHELALL